MSDRTDLTSSKTGWTADVTGKLRLLEKMSVFVVLLLLLLSSNVNPIYRSSPLGSAFSFVNFSCVSISGLSLVFSIWRLNGTCQTQRGSIDVCIFLLYLLFVLLNILYTFTFVLPIGKTCFPVTCNTGDITAHLLVNANDRIPFAVL